MPSCHLPLARWLTEKGHPSDHVADHGLAAASDATIWSTALALEAAIITKDKDFVQLRTLSKEGPSIVWVRLANTRRSVLLALLEELLPEILSALQLGETLIEIG